MLCEKQAKQLEEQHIFELLSGVNPEYETVCAQVTSQDPLPPIGTVFSLIQGEENRRVMSVKIPSNTSLDQSALSGNASIGGRGDGGCPYRRSWTWSW